MVDETDKIFTKEWFFDLESRLRIAGLDSDSESFDVIKSRLQNKEPLSPDEFARQAIYVVLAGGFSQKTAKTIHKKICDFLTISNQLPVISLYDSLIKIFNNKNKINAVVKIWENRQKYRDDYYALPDDLSRKLDFISALPHIGKITANHLARNLGEDIFKYDIWIQRLGVIFVTQLANSKQQIINLVDNQKLNPETKAACDEMFAHLVGVTGLPRGYIDVVLWKAAQQGMIKI